MEINIEDLVKRLKEIHLARIKLVQEERNIIDAIEKGIKEDIQVRRGQPVAAATPTLVIDRPTATQSYSTAAGPYQVGDKIYVTNSLGALTPFGRRAGIRDRAAIIIGLTGNRIDLTNYRGKTSWRSTKNIRRLTPQEEAQLN